MEAIIPSIREVRNIDIGSSAVLLSIEAGPPLAARQGDTVGTLLPPLQLLEVCPGAVDLGLQGLTDKPLFWYFIPWTWRSLRRKLVEENSWKHCVRK